MINAINGSIVSILPNEVVILTNSGLEFKLEISSQSATELMSLEEKERKNVRLLSILQHREDNMSLFGFTKEKERNVFLELIEVPGIGPKGALKILSGITLEKFLLALDKQDVKTLSRVPGIGGKTAQKIILQLRNILITEPDLNSREIEESNGEKINRIIDEKQYKDLVTSFTDSGYEKKSVERELSQTLKENESEIEKLSGDNKFEYIFKLLFRRLNK